MQEAGKSSYYLQDDHGTPMCLVNMQEQVDAAYAYDEFGLPAFAKGKIKGGLRNNLYLSNLKEDVDIAGHVNEFICAFA